MIPIDTAQLGTYLDTLFANHEWSDDEFMMIRGVGEKGTKQYGTFSEDVLLQPSLVSTTDAVAGAAARYSQHEIGAFIVPAILSGTRATEDNVKLLPALVLDLDEVPAWEAVRWLEEEIGAPSMVVASGGRNEHGPKLHAYYVFEKPLPASEVVPLAVKMAGLIGGDPSFMRRTQPIRVPGSVHLKNSDPKPVTLETYNSDTFTAEELRERMEGREPSPWAKSITTLNRLSSGVGFSPAASADQNALLHTTIREGGQDGITRWDAFSRVTGHYLHTARTGQMTPQDAYERVCGWAAAHLSPPWPEDRIRKEFSALYDREVKMRGPFPEVHQYVPILNEEQQSNGLGLKAWAAHRWVVEPRPQHTFIVDRLIIKGEPHLFVAEGGAGKTFLMGDLAMKVASFQDGDEMEWCGQKITAGGSVVLILCEDSKTEMHIRLLELDAGRGLISKAGDKLIPLPMSAVGGAFPLSERDQKTGSATTSQRWSEMISLLRDLPDLALVVIDTLNSVTHGDENSAVVISEMMREAQRVCGDLGAALVINHHMRKSNEPVGSLEALRDSIRGSTAIPSYFRINFGMFRAVDWERRCKALGIKPHRDAIWRFGIAKANIMGLIDGEKTLVRQDGGMVDRTEQDPFSQSDMSERVAWLVLAAQKAAADGHPFSHGGKNAIHGFYARRTQLPECLHQLGYKELGRAVDAALSGKMLVQCAAKGEKGGKWLDVPEGPLATNDRGEELAKGAWRVPNWNGWAYDEGQGICVQRQSIQGASQGSFGFSASASHN